MTLDDVHRLLRETATATSELSVRLRVVEEAGLRLPVEVEVRAADAVVGDPADGDIMALAFIVMMEASKSAREDLKAIMAGVKAINDAKRGLRDLLGVIAKERGAPSGCPPLCAPDLDAVLPVLLTAYGLDLDREMDGLKSGLEAVGEMDDLLSLELQMAMDRRSRMMSTLANIMKKLADTNDQLVQNLK